MAKRDRNPKHGKANNLPCHTCGTVMLGIQDYHIRKDCIGCGGHSLIDNEARKDSIKQEYAEKRRRKRA